MPDPWDLTEGQTYFVDDGCTPPHRAEGVAMTSDQASSAIPYVCVECGASGVKLWRQYNTFPEHQRLLCAVHAAADQHADIAHIDAEGRYLSPIVGFPVDSLGWLVPAVPTDDGEMFWGYTSIPDIGVAWWRALPLRQP